MPLDIGIGILLAIGVSEWFSITLTPLLIVVGIAAALLPDIDIMTKLFGRWRHREFTHYPLIYVAISVLLYLLLPVPYVMLITLGVLAHFIHDSIGIGWGIAWLWPFSGRKFLVFPEQSRRRVLGWFVTWLPKDEERIRTQHYEGASTNWVREFYGRPSLLAFIEYGGFLVALVTLAAYIW
jgi:hypothetical protein